MEEVGEGWGGMRQGECRRGERRGRGGERRRGEVEERYVRGKKNRASRDEKIHDRNFHL